jgi:hypothetical protein
MNELSLTPYDERFLKTAGIKIPDDVIWDLGAIEAEPDVCAEAEAARWLWDAWAKPEAAV